ncbi:hypothetical protein PR048_019948 [Dryococelus australis]|uniref:Uncharacterized protein n=1 Tax=Dryococelus australis TaxID=614101 RepID=A0ABQ9H517_9NEOP|nr:hypothetical protein PR048_019948 [Dryococelus australis]
MTGVRRTRWVQIKRRAVFPVRDGVILLPRRRFGSPRVWRGCRSSKDRKHVISELGVHLGLRQGPLQSPSPLANKLIGCRAVRRHRPAAMVHYERSRQNWKIKFPAQSLGLQAFCLLAPGAETIRRIYTVRGSVSKVRNRVERASYCETSSLSPKSLSAVAPATEVCNLWLQMRKFEEAAVGALPDLSNLQHAIGWKKAEPLKSSLPPVVPPSHMLRTETITNIHVPYPGYPMRVKLEENKAMGETGDPRENPPPSGIVRHDYHLRKFGSDLARATGLLVGFGSSRTSSAIFGSTQGVLERLRLGFVERIRRCSAVTSTNFLQKISGRNGRVPSDTFDKPELNSSEHPLSRAEDCRPRPRRGFINASGFPCNGGLMHVFVLMEGILNISFSGEDKLSHIRETKMTEDHRDASRRWSCTQAADWRNEDGEGICVYCSSNFRWQNFNHESHLHIVAKYKIVEDECSRNDLLSTTTTTTTLANELTFNVRIALCVHATSDKHQRSYAEGRETAPHHHSTTTEFPSWHCTLRQKPFPGRRHTHTRASDRNNVNLDSSLHKTDFHCSSVQLRRSKHHLSGRAKLIVMIWGLCAAAFPKYPSRVLRFLLVKVGGRPERAALTQCPSTFHLRRTNTKVNLGLFTFRLARLDSQLRWQPTITPLSKSNSSVPRAISLRSHVEKEPVPKDISQIDPNRIISWKTVPVHEGKADNTTVISVFGKASMHGRHVKRTCRPGKKWYMSFI